MSIVGTDGNDRLEGTQFDDVIEGLDGDDVVEVSEGNDVVDGGEGEDELYVLAPYASSQSYLLTGSTFSGANSAILTQFQNIEEFRMTAYAGTDFLTFDASAWGDNPNATFGVNLAIYSDASTVIGSSLDDRFRFDGIGHQVDGGVGLDSVSVSSGYGIVVRANGDGTLVEGEGLWVNSVNVERISFSIGTNDEGYFIDGSDADITLSLGNGVGDDILIGGSGDDRFWSIYIVDQYGGIASGGYDVFTGNGGADEFDFRRSAVGLDGVTITDLAAEDWLDLTQNTDPNYLVSTFIGSAAFSGSAGEFRFEKTDGITLVQYDADGDGTADGTLVISNGEFDLVQFVGGSGAENLGIGVITEGTEAGDTYSGGAGRDGIRGFAGNDTLAGGDGDDSLYGGAGWDALEGGEGNDYLDGGTGHDTASYATASAGVTVSLALAGEAQETVGAGTDLLIGIENLEGSQNADILVGENSYNTLIGNAGDDLLKGLGGNDALKGGLGNDQLVGGNGNDVLRGGEGQDVLIGGIGYDIMFGDADNDYLKGANGTDRLYGGFGNDVIEGGNQTDYLFGQQGDDILLGDAGDDYILGNAGTDTLNGGAGNDRLDGNNGNDILRGGDGNDILIGSWGVDMMTGGEGADTFRFTAAGHTGKFDSTADTILDFSSADGDVIDLSQIDAIAGGGDDAFTFIGDAAFSGTAGELRFYAGETGVYVVGDTDGDGVGDLFIALEGVTDLTAAAFVL